MDDAKFAAMMEEAMKHIGKPYVFGANGPNAFDCSSYVSWVINHSGIGSVGRQTAQGLFNLSTPVAYEGTMPGDLLFFHSTYSGINPVTHVALYLGGGRFIHCGDPIGYASLSSPYWSNHFYAVGRIN
jgi:cell wall-associated NlpC family hydrolase